MKRLLMVGMLLLVVAGAGWGAVPQTISFQGRLTDLSGQVVSTPTDGFVSMWDAATGGNRILQKEVSFRPDQNGVFNLSISVMGGPVFDVPYWISVRFGGNPESARQALLSVPYAMRAHVADSLSTGATTTGNYVSRAGDVMSGPLTFAGGVIGGQTGVTQFGNNYKLEVEGAGDSGDLKLGVYKGGTQPVVTNLLTINKLGEVGVKTLSINDTLRVYNSGYLGYYSLLRDADGLKIKTPTPIVDAMTITNSGKVGIGTINPAEKLQVNGNLAIESGNKLILQTPGSAFSLSNNGVFNLGASYVDVGGSHTKANIIAATSAGNVGVGTATPTTRLQVKQASDVDTEGLSVAASGNDVELRMFASGAAGDPNCRIDAKSNLGGQPGLKIFTGNSPRLVIKGNGSITVPGILYTADHLVVGADTTTPTAKMQVDGDMIVGSGNAAFKVYPFSAASYNYDAANINTWVNKEVSLPANVTTVYSVNIMWKDASSTIWKPITNGRDSLSYYYDEAAKKVIISNHRGASTDPGPGFTSVKGTIIYN